ncbi:carboxymuconolactone decarboxylase family protein [Nonomuraea monospora]|uniref:Carboxymuconolactone decarboxylase family protein n=1 Tax=Nonomuraea monospora TaxID=568818 RepID=A0ABN3D0H9_9ACTN
MTSQFARLPLFQIARESYAAMGRFAQTVTQSALRSGVEAEVVHLVKIRVSQVNGCAYCIDMHIIDAHAAGVTAQRVYLLDAWRHSPRFFSEPEQAALGLAEALTLLGTDAVDDDVYQRARKHFSEEQTAHLIFVATVMNAWNRLAISARLAPGGYKGRS